MIDDWVKVTSSSGSGCASTAGCSPTFSWTPSKNVMVSTSIVLRATAGFGLRHHLRTDETLTMSEDPSVMVVAVTHVAGRGAAPRLTELQPRGMLTVERARVIRGEVTRAPMPEELNEATKLTIYVGRHERVDGVAAYLRICDVLHRRGVAGASVLLGVDGTFHGSRERARSSTATSTCPRW